MKFENKMWNKVLENFIMFICENNEWKMTLFDENAIIILTIANYFF
jgi:hypothetical protein